MFNTPVLFIRKTIFISLFLQMISMNNFNVWRLWMLWNLFVRGYLTLGSVCLIIFRNKKKVFFFYLTDLKYFDYKSISIQAVRQCKQTSAAPSTTPGNSWIRNWFSCTPLPFFCLPDWSSCVYLFSPEQSQFLQSFQQHKTCPYRVIGPHCRRSVLASAPALPLLSRTWETMWVCF